MSNLPTQSRPRDTDPLSDIGTSEQQTTAQSFDYAQGMARIVPVMPAFSLLTCLIFVVIYVTGGEWQNLGVAGCALLSSLSFFFGGWWARRPYPHAEQQATVILMVSTILCIPGTSLFLSGATLALALTTAALVVLLSTLLVPPHRRAFTWGIAVLAGASSWLWAVIPVSWQRFDVGVSPMTAWLIRGLTGAAVLLLLAQVYLAYRRIRTLRVRLSVAFAMLALLVALAVSGTSILLGIQTVQGQMYRQLESDVVLKLDAVANWVDQLQFALSTLVVEGYEVSRAQSVLLQTGVDTIRTTNALALRNRFGLVIEDTQWFNEVYLATREGDVLLSTHQDRVGWSAAGTDYFTQGLEAPYVSSPQLDPITGEVSVVFSQPLIAGGNYVYGVILGRTDLGQLIKIMSTGTTGETGATHLVGPGNLLLTQINSEGSHSAIESPVLEAAAVLAPQSAPDDAEPTDIASTSLVQSDTYVNHEGTEVIGAYTWLPDLSSVMISEVDRAEVLAGARTTVFVNGGVSLLAAALAVVLGVFISGSISRPLTGLAGMATDVADGRLDLVTAEQELSDALAGRQDEELDKLASAFRAMTAQVRDLVGSLEERVNERTRGLQAVTQVSRATTSMLDLDELLPQVVELVQERFDLYYVGLFLLDEAEEYAVLRAGTGEAGARMLAEGWRLRVDGGSMIGQAVVRGHEIIKQESTRDSALAGTTSAVVRFENPLLPLTRSELALPLRYGERVIGAMTVQSERPGAFDETNIAVFQNMADQIAVAVQNARLFAETSDALERAQLIQFRYQTQAWSSYLTSRQTSGYEYRSGEVVPLAGIPGTADESNAASEPKPAISIGPTGELQIPIVQGGQFLGVVGLRRDGGAGDGTAESGWTQADVAQVEALVEQLALAAENQRLLDETQRREAAERLTREVTARMQEPIELEDVLRTAADEIRRAFRSDWVVVRLAPELATFDASDGQGQGDGHG